MTEPTLISEAIAKYVEQLLRGMLNEDERRRKRGETDYLDRQLDMFEAKQRACSGDECPKRCGCEMLIAIMSRLEKEIEKRHPSPPAVAP